MFLLHRKKRRCLSLKISDDLLFSHRPIFYHQSLQRTDFAPPPFTQLNSSFCSPFIHFTKKFLFPTYLRNIFPKFRFFAPSLWAAPRGDRPTLLPSLRHCITYVVELSSQ